MSRLSIQIHKSFEADDSAKADLTLRGFVLPSLHDFVLIRTALPAMINSQVQRETSHIDGPMARRSKSHRLNTLHQGYETTMRIYLLMAALELA